MTTHTLCPKLSDSRWLFFARAFLPSQISLKCRLKCLERGFPSLYAPGDSRSSVPGFSSVNVGEGAWAAFALERVQKLVELAGNVVGLQVEVEICWVWVREGSPDRASSLSVAIPAVVPASRRFACPANSSRRSADSSATSAKITINRCFRSANCDSLSLSDCAHRVRGNALLPGDMLNVGARVGW